MKSKQTEAKKSEMEKEVKFRVFWCYGTLTLVVIAAMLTRTWYLEVTDELENKPDKKYLSWRIKYM